MGHLPCPLCPRGFLGDVKELQERVASVLSRPLHCPICSEPQYGLPALHSHLNFHLPLEHYKQQSLIENQIPIRNNAAFKSELTATLGREPDLLLQKSESIPSLESLDIRDDRLSVEFSPPHSHLFSSICDSPNSPSTLKHGLSRPSSQSSGAMEEFSATPSENYGCDVCGLVFSSDNFLSIHKDIIHKNKSYFTVDCKLCKNKFNDLESYRTHVRQSHSERRYFCEECPKTFKLKGSLAVHKRMYHDGNPSVCLICNKKFPSTARREFHERRYHNSTKSIFKTPTPVQIASKNSPINRKTQHQICNIDTSNDENISVEMQNLFPAKHMIESCENMVPTEINIGNHCSTNIPVYDKNDPSFQGLISMLNWKHIQPNIQQLPSVSLDNYQTIPITNNSNESMLSAIPLSMSSIQETHFNNIPIVSHSATENSNIYNPAKDMLNQNIKTENNILNQLITASSSINRTKQPSESEIQITLCPDKKELLSCVEQLQISTNMISKSSADSSSNTISHLEISSSMPPVIESVVQVPKGLFKSNGGSPNGSKSNKTKECQSSEGKQWECDVCKKSFTTKYFLKKHKRLHTGETPYHCEECGKSFTFQQSYHKHILYHSDDKPHQCTHCGRSFKEMSTLHNHVRIHTGEKPFVCETCGKAFRQRVSYLVHLRIHTGAMPYTCPDCNVSFRYKVSLRSHKCKENTNSFQTKLSEEVPQSNSSNDNKADIFEDLNLKLNPNFDAPIAINNGVISVKDSSSCVDSKEKNSNNLNIDPHCVIVKESPDMIPVFSSTIVPNTIFSSNDLCSTGLQSEANFHEGARLSSAPTSTDCSTIHNDDHLEIDTDSFFRSLFN